jgi:hypothetical protein
MARRCIVLLAIMFLMPGIALAQNQPEDEISKLLFEAYLNGPRKTNTSTVMAASHIVAERGRMSGFWRDVLAELSSGDEHSEVNCVRILGNMLATDAAARDAIRRQKETGEVSAWIPSVHIGPEVVEDLLKRGTKADRFRIDHYTIALARARVPETRKFFASILKAKKGAGPVAPGAGETVPESFNHLDSTRFHAAVGLAQLGDPLGIEWLIANCEEVNGHVEHARPYGASPGGNLGSCCLPALRQLTGKRELATRAEWEAWWRSVDRKRLEVGAVQLAETGGAF